MNIRDAILKAADWIEKNPALFDFEVCEVPACGSPGCAIGWIGHFMGRNAGYTGFKEIAISMGLPDHEGTFYQRMDDINAVWDRDAKACSHTLRLYADKYHPMTSKPAGASICIGIMSRPYDEKELSHV